MRLAYPSHLFSQGIDIRGFGGIGLVGLSSQKDAITINDSDYKLNIAATPMLQFGVSSTLGERFFLQPGVTWQRLQIQISKTQMFGEHIKFMEEYRLSIITVPLKVGFRVMNPETYRNLNIRLFGGIDGQILTSLDQKKASNLGDLKKEDFNKLITYTDFGMGIDLFFLFADIGYRIGLDPAA